MKHLYLFAFAMFAVIGLNQSSAQNIIKTNATGVGTCDGTAFNTYYGWWGDSGWNWSWYQDSIQIAGADSFISNLCPGDYTVTATDSFGCIQNRSITIIDQYITGSLWVDNGYYAYCSGQASIFPYGGTPPYSILWNTGDTTDHIQYLCDGNYSVTIVDATNDSITFPFTIQVQEPRALAADSWVYDDYDSTCSGYAAVNPTGGTQPYSMLWSTGDTSYYAYNLCTGTYSVTIVDALNDSITVIVNVGPIPEPFAAEFWSYDNSHFYNSSQCSGIASVHPRGGTPPYSILWDTYDMTENVEHLCVGNHSVTLTDATNTDTMFTVFTLTDSSVIYGRDDSPSISSDLSVTENPLESISIYPNPFTDVIKIDNQNGSVQSMKLTDLNSRIIGEKTGVNSGVIEFDGLESIGSGTYFLILSGEKHSKTYKLIK